MYRAGAQLKFLPKVSISDVMAVNSDCACNLLKLNKNYRIRWNSLLGDEQSETAGALPIFVRGRSLEHARNDHRRRLPSLYILMRTHGN